MEETEENPFANMAPQHEHLYADDPKKALKGFYEREGMIFFLLLQPELLAYATKEWFDPKEENEDHLWC